MKKFLIMMFFFLSMEIFSLKANKSHQPDDTLPLYYSRWQFYSNWNQRKLLSDYSVGYFSHEVLLFLVATISNPLRENKNPFYYISDETGEPLWGISPMIMSCLDFLESAPSWFDYPHFSKSQKEKFIVLAPHIARFLDYYATLFLIKAKKSRRREFGLNPTGNHTVHDFVSRLFEILSRIDANSGMVSDAINQHMQCDVTLLFQREQRLTGGYNYFAKLLKKETSNNK